jgi:hypothetical protein
MLPSEGYIAPKHFTVTIKPADGVAFTSGTRVEANANWLKREIDGEAVGSIIHEAVHVVQQYGQHGGNRTPGWLVEGIADYIRWFKFEPQSHGADIVWIRQRGKNFSPRYDGGYRDTANFLNWVSEKYDADIIRQLNAALREGKYDTGLWEKFTSKTIEELDAEWKLEIRSSLSVGKAG